MALSNDLGKFLAYTCTKIYPNESWDNLGNNDIHIKYFQGEGHSRMAFKNPKIAHLEKNGSKNMWNLGQKYDLGPVSLNSVWSGMKNKGGVWGCQSNTKGTIPGQSSHPTEGHQYSATKVFYIRHLIAPGCRPYPAMNNTAQESSTGQGHWLIIT